MSSLILATGADSRWLGVPGEWEHRGGGVSSCATCDGYGVSFRVRCMINDILI